MSRQRDLASVRQLDTSTPETNARDTGRLIGSVDEILRSLPQFFRERLAPGRERITHTTSRPVLKFGECAQVETGTDDVRLRLPSATASDAGRSIKFIKRSASNSAIVVSPVGVSVNADTSVDLGDIGLHEVYWDGVAWWTRGVA
jgi:hypothetical protein